MGAEVKDFDFGDKRAAKRLDLADQYALVAAREAVTDSGIVNTRSSVILSGSAFTAEPG